MTTGENERLAVLETKVTVLQGDVTEIKADVKALVSSMNSRDVAEATERSSYAARNRSRADLGVWVRSVLPIVVSLLAAAVTVYGIVTR